MVTSTLDRKDVETFSPETGATVTVIIPATVPAKLTRPATGALTTVPTGAA